MVLLVSALSFMFLDLGDAGARRRKRRRRSKPKPRATRKASAAIKRLAGPYKWGLTPNRVLKLLNKKIKKEYIPKIAKHRGDPMLQDRLRREMRRVYRRVVKSYVKFTGQATSWDSSIVDDQFMHKNQESMLVIIEQDQQRFFFFFNKRLYKHMIAFNSDHPKYKGLTFARFLQVLIQVYGQGKPVFKPDAAGINKLHHVEWRGPSRFNLWALDKSGVYGNFCLVLIDRVREAKLEESRKLVRSTQPRKPAMDPLIKSVTRPKTDGSEEEKEGEGGKGARKPPRKRRRSR